MVEIDSYCIKFSIENDKIKVIKHKTEEELIYTFDVKTTQDGSINHFRVRDIFCMAPYLILTGFDGTAVKHYDNVSDELSKFINRFSD
ncbi:hypothetical protein [Pseudoalteromonas gelatinilytica]|uniref:Uncharacterized protein n=1 Tax=Pseudoalteromonas gelatinilytica TaxID=1703256 RepID=A0ABQ1TCQ1_9GAMM|nr:hypothetical protein [Pseudoalteromonas profundi]GGE91351.1 hypothetical protein GCM10008027_15260 [Pseudoalteromonas profundi]